MFANGGSRSLSVPELDSLPSAPQAGLNPLDAPSDPFKPVEVQTNQRYAISPLVHTLHLDFEVPSARASDCSFGVHVFGQRKDAARDIRHPLLATCSEGSACSQSGIRIARESTAGPSSKVIVVRCSLQLEHIDPKVMCVCVTMSGTNLHAVSELMVKAMWEPLPGKGLRSMMARRLTPRHWESGGAFTGTALLFTFARWGAWWHAYAQLSRAPVATSAAFAEHICQPVNGQMALIENTLKCIGMHRPDCRRISVEVVKAENLADRRSKFKKMQGAAVRPIRYSLQRVAGVPDAAPLWQMHSVPETTKDLASISWGPGVGTEPVVVDKALASNTTYIVITVAHGSRANGRPPVERLSDPASFLGQLRIEVARLWCLVEHLQCRRGETASAFLRLPLAGVPQLPQVPVQGSLVLVAHVGPPDN